ncbi:ABC transporter permease [Planctomycetota bacterium]
MTTTINDIKFSIRQLRKSPAFTMVAVLSLALGIGANTAIFSVINGLLLKSLPVPNPQELRVIDFKAKAKETSNYPGGMGSQKFPYPAYSAFRDKAEGFKEVFGFSPIHDMTAMGSTGVRNVAGLRVSGNFFAGYGAQALMGRTLGPEDDQLHATPVTVLTYRVWERLFGADPNVIGRSVPLNKTVFTVVGVLPQSYKGPIVGDEADFYVPLIGAQPLYNPNSSESWWVQIMARRDNQVSKAQCQASLDRLFTQFLIGSRDTLEKPQILLKQGKRGLGKPENTPSLWILQALVMLVLFIACTNLAGLLLSRGAGRRYEFAVRAAIGAQRGHLIRQSLLESLILSLLGMGIGLLFALWMKAGVVQFFIASEAGLHIDATIDIRVISFGLGMACVTTFLCGMIPAWQAGKVQPLAGLKDTQTQTAPRIGIGRALMVTQIAMSVVLVLGTGLLVQTLVNLHRIEVGFDAESLLTFQVRPYRLGYQDHESDRYYTEAREAIASIPGTGSVAFSQYGLVSCTGLGFDSFELPGRSDLPEKQRQAFVHRVSDGFFSTMGIPLFVGRDFNASDTKDTLSVAIVSEAFARKYFEDGNALGQNIRYEDHEHQIVGICRDIAYESLRHLRASIIYFAHSQHPSGATTFEVRSAVPPMSLVAAVRQRLSQIDPGIPLQRIATQQQLIKSSMAMERLFTLQCGILSLLALALASIGLYGLMAYNVSRRTREMGIRMALGARPLDVASPILREATVLSAIGIAIGMPIALTVSFWARSVFYGVKHYDLVSVIGSMIVLLAVGFLAAWIPARRAAKIDPMEALRYE